MKINNGRYNQIIDEVYDFYCKSFDNQCVIEIYLSFDTDPMIKVMFVEKIKNLDWFSQKWGLKIEERVLTPKERIELAGGKIQDKYPALVEMSLRVCDERDIPTKLITLTYKNETIEIYE